MKGGLTKEDFSNNGTGLVVDYDGDNNNNKAVLHKTLLHRVIAVELLMLLLDIIAGYGHVTENVERT
jgi:hypothetical protein